MIREVERLEPELKPLLLSESKILHHGKVPALHAGRSAGIAADVAVGSID